MPVPDQAVLKATILRERAEDRDLEAAVREHARLVYKVTYAVLRNHHDAEDATQETFLRFLRQRRPWREVGNTRAWLARVAWRVAVGRKQRPPEIGLEEAAQTVHALHAQGAGPEEIAATGQMAALIERLVAALPGDLRQTLTLSAIEELSSTEIADLLGIPEASVRTRLLRARELLNRKLRNLLEKEHG